MKAGAATQLNTCKYIHKCQESWGLTPATIAPHSEQNVPIQDPQYCIASPITIGSAIWGHMWTRVCTIWLCDNQAVVSCLRARIG